MSANAREMRKRAGRTRDSLIKMTLTQPVTRSGATYPRWLVLAALDELSLTLSAPRSEMRSISIALKAALLPILADPMTIAGRSFMDDCESPPDISTAAGTVTFT